MSEAPERVFIEPGRRMGKTLANEAKFRAVITAGQDAYTALNGVWFKVQIDGAGAVVYTALPMRPVGI